MRFHIYIFLKKDQDAIYRFTRRFISWEIRVSVIRLYPGQNESIFSGISILNIFCLGHSGLVVKEGPYSMD